MLLSLPPHKICDFAGTPALGPGGGTARTERKWNREAIERGSGDAQAAARGRRPLWTSNQPLEPKDEAVHLYGAQRHPHHRPAEDGPAPGRIVGFRSRRGCQRTPGAVCWHPEAGTGKESELDRALA